MNNCEKRKLIKARRRSKSVSEDPSTFTKNSAQPRLHRNKNIYNCSPKLLKDNNLNESEIESSRITKTNLAFTPYDNMKMNRSLAERSHTSDEPPKFSVNNRLKKYRLSLTNRKNEIVKVHQVLNASSKDYQTNLNANCTLNASTKNSILGKRCLTDESDQKKHSLHYESENKKSKIEDVETENARTDIKPGTSSGIIEMDWSPIDEIEIISNIQKLRETHRSRRNSKPEEYSFSSPSNTSKSTESDILYIVVDTNVFISHLHIVQNILSEDHVDHDNIVYVPWIVLQELDFFKDGRSGSPIMLKAAKTAVKYINENLISKHKRLKGQTVQEALSQKESNSNADDNILFCCINLVRTSKNVVLLSNDINLRNKALINNIASYGPKNILEKVMKMKVNGENKQKVDKITNILANVCTEIILIEMKEAYGSVLFNVISKPPWDFKQCLVYFKRFWSPVFSLVISQKQCFKVLEDLLKLLHTDNDLTAEDNMDDFVKLCLSLCVYFKNCLSKHHKIVKTCIDDITTILK